MAMSRIRHLVWPTQSEARNSCADEKARAAKPNSFSKSGSDSRTDSSSSTTDTSERVTFIIPCHTHRGRLRMPRLPSKPSAPQRMANEDATGGGPCHKDALLQWRAPLSLSIGSMPISTRRDEDDCNLL